MKALSGRQPWWWAILHAGKRVENRRWNTHYRGPFLLHASKGCTLDEWRQGYEWMRSAFGFQWVLGRVPALSDMQRGGIVGRARICDVIHPGDHLHASKLVAAGIDTRWWMPEQFGFVLREVEPLPFRACRGALGFFEVPL